MRLRRLRARRRRQVVDPCPVCGAETVGDPRHGRRRQAWYPGDIVLCPTIPPNQPIMIHLPKEKNQ